MAFNIGIIEAYFELKNVIKSAPEVTFWGGQRFYDRYNIDSSDYFWLNTSGVGAGVYNIPLGPGSLQLAYFGGIKSGTGAFFLDDTSFDNFTLDVNSGSGEFYRHVFDVRWGDVDFLWGKLKLVLIGSYQQGGDFTIAYNDGTTGDGHVENSGGVGGGIVQQWDLPPNRGASLALSNSAYFTAGDLSISIPALSTWISSTTPTFLRSLRMV